MALKTYKPYTKSTRGTILVDKSNLWKGKPFKSLTSVKDLLEAETYGRITARNVGDGHKQKYRNIDFYRKELTQKGQLKELNMIQIDLAISC